MGLRRGGGILLFREMRCHKRSEITDNHSCCAVVSVVQISLPDAARQGEIQSADLINVQIVSRNNLPAVSFLNLFQQSVFCVSSPTKEHLMIQNKQLRSGLCRNIRQFF